jgi:fibronectin-binding autotransporter adhesin
MRNNVSDFAKRMLTDRFRYGISLRTLVTTLAFSMPMAAHAGSYIASTQTELAAAIIAANADGDSTATITLGGNITLSNNSGFSLAKTMTIDTNGFVLTGGRDTTFAVADGAQFTFTGKTATTGIAGIPNGSLNMTGSGTKIISGMTGTYYGAIGNSGGILRIDGASQLTAGNGYSGGLAPSGGGMVVSGAGTLVNASGGNTSLSTGETLLIEKGAHTILASSISFGGVLTVTDTGSLLTATSITTTTQTGNFIVSNGGQIQTVNTTLGGANGLAAGGRGDISVSGSGSSWSASTGFRIHKGTLSILDGGLVTAPIIEFASPTNNTAGLNATVLISGAGSTLAMTGPASMKVGVKGPASITVANGGLLDAGTSQIALTTTVATGVATLNIGGAEGEAATAAGTVKSSGIVFGSGTGTVNFNHTDTDYLFDVALSGNGSVNQIGSGTTTLSGANSYTGPTTIRNGTVRISADTNLGNAAGLLVFDGGALNTTQSFNMTRAITLNAGGGTIATDASTTLGLASVISGAGTLIKQGDGTLTLTGANTYAGGTAINGGVLQIASDAVLGAATGALSFDGGTLQTTTSFASARNIALTGDGTLLTDGGTVFSLGGAITGAGSLTKDGTGATILTGTNSYKGTTSVNAGTLFINGDQSAATGLTIVNSGATLGGSGTIGGNVNIADGGTLAPGNSPGTLTINGNLSLAAGSASNFEFGAANVVGGPLNDLVKVGGNLVLDGTLNVSVATGGSFNAGIYRVFNYVGTLTDNGLDIGTFPRNSDLYVQTSVANQVNLVNTAGQTLNFWDGPKGQNNGAIDGGSGIWQAAASDSWTQIAGDINAPYANGSFAIFSAAPGTVTVDNSLGAVTASGMQFASNGYLITGGDIALVGPQSQISVGDGTGDGASMTATIASNLTGATQLEKTDLGTLVLSGTNSYTGGTLITAGTLRVSNDANLGDATGAIGFDGGTLNTTTDITSSRNVGLTGTGNILTAAGTTLSLTGLVSGTGALTKSGTGTLVLSGDSSGYTASTSVVGGTLAVDGKLGSTVDVQSAGRLEGNGQVGGITNNGVVAVGRGGIDMLTVAGDYAGTGGLLEIKTVLGDDSSATDRLIVNGSTSGTTQVSIINRGGLGAATIDGIKIINVVGTSAGTFKLNGDYVFQGEQAIIAGAYGYRLAQNGVSTPADGDWYLRSALLNPVDPTQPTGPLYQPGVPVYEAYAQSLLALNGLPTLQQRVGNRSWADTGVQAGTGVWGRMEGGRQRPTTAFSTSNADKNIDTWQAQMGVDTTLSQRSDGAALMGGITAHYGKVDTSIASIYGNGSIDTHGYGLGATLTWYGPQGFYTDGQAQMTWFDSDLKSNTLGKLANNNKGTGKAFSLEVGKRSPVGGNLTLTPQIQMVYSHVNFDTFTDPAAAVISASRGDSLKTRWGVSLDHQATSQSGSGQSHVYGIADLTYEWHADPRFWHRLNRPGQTFGG